MVPHIQIEECLEEIVGIDDEGLLRVAVTAVPDEKRGERLIVLHTDIDFSSDELRQKMTQAGLPNIYLPGESSFFQVDEIPVLGSGKLDLRALKDTALRLTATD